MSNTLERRDGAEPPGGGEPPTAEPPGGDVAPQDEPVPAPTPRSRRHSDRPFKIISLVGIAVLLGFVTYVVVKTETGRSAGVQYPVTKPTSLKPGSAAPSFTLPRLGGGAPVSQATAAGKPMMINFFASWCTNCRVELKSIATASTQASGKVAVIGIDTSDQAPTTAQQLLNAAGANYPVGVDPKARVAQKYKITGLPVTYFVNAQDRVVGVAFGSKTTKYLDHWVQRLTAGTGT